MSLRVLWEKLSGALMLLIKEWKLIIDLFPLLRFGAEERGNRAACHTAYIRSSFGKKLDSWAFRKLHVFTNFIELVNCNMIKF